MANHLIWANEFGPNVDTLSEIHLSIIFNRGTDYKFFERMFTVQVYIFIFKHFQSRSIVIFKKTKNYIILYNISYWTLYHGNIL